MVRQRSSSQIGFGHIGLRWFNWETKGARRQVDGKTIELRILISPFGDESEPCPGSGSNEVCRNSHPFILPSAITSTFKGILSQETNLKFTAMLHLSDGTSFVLHNSGKPEST